MTLSPDAGFADALYQGLGADLRPGHELTFVNNGSVFDAIVDEVSNARSSVHILAYIWEKGIASDRLIAAIAPKARAGLACRIMVDAFGSSDFEKDTKGTLTAAGCDVRIFRPLPGVDKLARNHRKIVVIDGKIGITGGFGVRDNWLGDGLSKDHWRDSNVRFTGPAVADMQQAFAQNWQEASGPPLPPEAFPAIVPTGDSGSRAAFIASTGALVGTRAERLTQLAILAARRRLWITNAYFVPGDAILAMLNQKAKDGVDVRVLTAGTKSDSTPSLGAQKNEYGTLLQSGVRIWEYEPAMIHTKTMLIDDALVVVGSINLDPLSLNKLEEGSLVVEDAPFAALLGASFDKDTAHAKELSPKR